MKKQTAHHDDNAHARFAPSTFKNREKCAQFSPTKSPPGQAAIEGTMLHSVLEKPSDKSLRSGLSSDQLTWIEMIEDYTSSIPFIADKKSKVYKELKLDLKPLGIVHCTHGTADLIVIEPCGKIAHLVDYKMGRMSVDDAETNIQMWIYCLGLWKSFKAVKTIHVHILQPKTNEVGQATFYLDEDYERFLTRARKIAETADDPSSKATPHPDLCRFCSKYFTCPAVNRLISNEVQSSGEVELPSSADFETFQTSNDAAARVMAYAKFLEEWGKAVQSEITKAATSGVLDLESWTLVSVRGKKKITDVQGTFNLLRETYEINYDQFLQTCEPNMKEVSELVASVTGRHKVEVANEINQTLLDNNLAEQLNGYSFLKKK